MTQHSPTKPTYADHPWQGTAVVQQNEQVATDTYRIRFAAPEIARQILPGQFIMIRLPGALDPLLGRPLAVYDVIDDGEVPTAVDVVYLVVGRMTGQLAQLKPGRLVEVWGPLGNGFPVHETGQLLIVAGGIGQTPFLMLAREYLHERTYGDPPRQVPKADRVTFCYGARTKTNLACVEDFRSSGIQVCIATDDGTEGHHGLVTDLIQPAVEQFTGPTRIVTCGPEPMLAATARIAQELKVPCEVSLETPMACGMGICFSCVAKVRDKQGGWDYRRTCVDGPVFNAEDVEFS